MWVGSSPLARGLRVRPSVEARGYPGSSPLARGLPTTFLPGAPNVRIIPARAGFTGKGLERSSHAADHPRSRGVYLVAPPLPPFPGGSSPLARGLR